jgi:hypothetical protein
LLKNEKLKPLAEKYSLVFLAEVPVEGTKVGPGEAVTTQTGFNFTRETTVSAGAEIQFLGFDKKFFDIRTTEPRNFIADLLEHEFEKNPDPEKISIDHAGISGSGVHAIERHVYFQHINTRSGSDFYVFFQVVAVEKNGL